MILFEVRSCGALSAPSVGSLRLTVTGSEEQVCLLIIDCALPDILVDVSTFVTVVWAWLTARKWI